MAKVKPAEEFLKSKGIKMPVTATIFELALAILERQSISHVYTQLGSTEEKVDDWPGLLIANFAVGRNKIHRENILITTNGDKHVIAFVKKKGYKVIQPNLDINRDFKILFGDGEWKPVRVGS